MDGRVMRGGAQKVTTGRGCYGCPHCGCDPDDPDDYCYVCGDCDDFADGDPEEGR